MTHTPSSWTAHWNDEEAWVSAGRAVAEEYRSVALVEPTIDHAEAVTDALLIAAAPDLLAALSLLIEELDDPSRLMVVNAEGSFALSVPAVLQARAAIAKARGEGEAT